MKCIRVKIGQSREPRLAIADIERQLAHYGFDESRCESIIRSIEKQLCDIDSAGQRILAVGSNLRVNHEFLYDGIKFVVDADYSSNGTSFWRGLWGRLRSR